MPTHARCPQCSASLPQNAQWCSLCHADLRPAPTPDLVSVSAVALDLPEQSTGPSIGPAPVRGRHRRSDTADTSSHEDDSADRRRAAPAAAASDTRELVADVPVDADGKPDLDVLTSQLMARLAATEHSGSGLPDIDAVPGGKWGVLFGAMIGLTLVLVLIGAVIGWVFLR